MTVATDHAACELAYLRLYHHVTQSLIGVARLHMTPEQRQQVKVWDDALEDIQVERWHQLGVPLDAMGMDRMFVMSDEAVERFRATTHPDALVSGSSTGGVGR